MVSRVITYCTCITALTSGAFYDSLGVESTQNSGTVKFLAEFYGHPRFNSKSTEKLQYLGLRRCKIPVMLQFEKKISLFSLKKKFSLFSSPVIFLIFFTVLGLFAEKLKQPSSFVFL